MDLQKLLGREVDVVTEQGLQTRFPHLAGLARYGNRGYGGRPAGQIANLPHVKVLWNNK